MLRMRAHAQLAVNAYFLGELVPAHAHLEQAMALSLPHHSRTPPPLARVLGLGYAALTLWMLGYPEQALTRSQEMLTSVQELSHAFSLARALYYAAWLHGLRREVHATQERAEASLALSTAQGFAQWVGPGTFWRGWAVAAQGQYEAGIAQMHQGLAIKRATGGVSILSTYLGGLAEGYGGSGQAQEGLSQLAEALAHVGTTGERYWEAELHRLRGALLLQQAIPDAHYAESCFQHALAVARDQQAKSLELRAATSLARLWQRQDKRQKAYALLAPVYNWFTEGFDTADLQQAKALLEELS